ncbi:MAG: hypothetical protein NVS2B8_21960 [Vulcanimicrobiaceae bacterium]
MSLALTVLGSGGPIANAHRASSGYLVSIDGVPRILVDGGGERSRTPDRTAVGRLPHHVRRAFARV